MTCKDCEHWGKPRDPVTLHGSYDISQRWSHRPCVKVIDAGDKLDQEIVDMPPWIAFVSVYEVYANELMTGPDFGCIHFEKKDEEEDSIPCGVKECKNESKYVSGSFGPICQDCLDIAKRIADKL